tara:strand:- start:2385 stop:2657 length:273 start_codon:yes stop_codon:yes gene_type:complete
MTEDEALNAAAVQLYEQLFGTNQSAMDDLHEYQQTADYANTFPGAPPHFEAPNKETQKSPSNWKYIGSLRTHYVLDTHGNAMELPRSSDF